MSTFTIQLSSEYYRIPKEQDGYTYGDLATGYLPNAIEADVRIYYFGVDTTELYNLYKDLYIGYYGGFYTVTPVDTFSKAMHAADMVLQGKLDEEIVLPVDKGGYGYICICQELIDAIVADLKSVNVEVTFSKTIITSSNPADAATFNTIKTPSNYKDGLDVTVNVNTAKYNVNNPKLIVKDQYGVLGEYSLKQSSGSAYTCNVPITGDISEIVATGFAAKEYTVSIPASSASLFRSIRHIPRPSRPLRSQAERPLNLFPPLPAQTEVLITPIRQQT